MNAGGVDKACKSNGHFRKTVLVADELVTRRYLPSSQE
jgi:hypothetical protein